MITKERLKELIEQGATIYKISKETFIAGASDFLKIVEVPSGLYSKEINDGLGCQPDYDLLFETKEEVEWYLEFGNITRTETLSFPTYRLFGINEIIVCTPRFLFSKLSDPAMFIIFDRNKREVVFEKSQSKRNYIEACRLAKKLFLEGSDDIE